MIEYLAKTWRDYRQVGTYLPIWRDLWFSWTENAIKHSRDGKSPTQILPRDESD